MVTPKFLNHRIRDRILAEAEVCYVAKICSDIILIYKKLTE